MTSTVINGDKMHACDKCRPKIKHNNFNQRSWFVSKSTTCITASFIVYQQIGRSKLLEFVLAFFYFCRYSNLVW